VLTSHLLCRRRLGGMGRCRRCRRLRTSQKRRGTRPTAAPRSVSTRLWRSTGTPSFPERIRRLESLQIKPKHSNGNGQNSNGFLDMMPCRRLRRSFNRILSQSVTCIFSELLLVFFVRGTVCAGRIWRWNCLMPSCYGCRCQKGKKGYDGNRTGFNPPAVKLMAPI
jgi:hypothetical protein